jgi:hypothetical protein
VHNHGGSGKRGGYKNFLEVGAAKRVLVPSLACPGGANEKTAAEPLKMPMPYREQSRARKNDKGRKACASAWWRQPLPVENLGPEATCQQKSGSMGEAPGGTVPSPRQSVGQNI